MKFIRFFNPVRKSDLGKPVPTKTKIPEWYKNSESTYISPENEVTAGLKKCAPYLDTLVSGYVLVTPFDIFVKEKSDGFVDVSWNGPEDYGDFIAERPKESGALMPRPAGHYPNHMVWAGNWGVNTPRGWSALMTHPLNRFDLPFTTTSGIIDSDKYSASGNLPFFIKEGFQGVIPAGTPFLQIIPIKRSSWKMIYDKGLADRQIKDNDGFRDGQKSYKNTLWQRKEYF
jgi:hypothetical protein